MKNILVFQDNSEIAEVIEPFCHSEDFRLLRVKQERILRSMINDRIPALLVLDISAAATSRERNIRLIREIRRKCDLPVIVVSEEGEETFRIQSLEAGADDCVGARINPLVLMARIKSQIRRCAQLSLINRDGGNIYRFADLVLNDEQRKVTVGEREVRLTPTEYQILKLLVTQKGRVFSVEQIYQGIWNAVPIGADNTVAVHITHLRKKIEKNPSDPRYLKVVWGQGYKVG